MNLTFLVAFDEAGPKITRGYELQPCKSINIVIPSRKKLLIFRHNRPSNAFEGMGGGQVQRHTHITYTYFVFCFIYRVVTIIRCFVIAGGDILLHIQCGRIRSRVLDHRYAVFQNRRRHSILPVEQRLHSFERSYSGWKQSGLGKAERNTRN